jgi:3-phenylpropionate/trans-cinnamate dioxygenase ferredoxin component
MESLELMDKQFVEVARMRDLPPGTVTIAVHGRDRVALTNVDGHVYGLATACTHAGASLAKGRLDGFLLQCPLHCSQFDVRSGRPQNPPAIDPVRTYEVRVEGDRILLGVID